MKNAMLKINKDFVIKYSLITLTLVAGAVLTGIASKASDEAYIHEDDIVDDQDEASFEAEPVLDIDN